jgi:hypothetical protein
VGLELQDTIPKWYHLISLSTGLGTGHHSLSVFGGKAQVPKLQDLVISWYICWFCMLIGHETEKIFPLDTRQLTWPVAPDTGGLNARNQKLISDSADFSCPLIHACPDCSLRGRCFEVVASIMIIVTTATVLCYRKPVKVEMTVRGHASLDA